MVFIKNSKVNFIVFRIQIDSGTKKILFISVDIFGGNSYSSVLQRTLVLHNVLIEIKVNPKNDRNKTTIYKSELIFFNLNFLMYSNLLLRT